VAQQVDSRRVEHDVRDPMANLPAVLAARERPMFERLELALSWNAVAAELRAGMAAVKAAEVADRRGLADRRPLDTLDHDNN
jgi:hypothetical protein